jgi:hypothetical protein
VLLVNSLIQTISEHDGDMTTEPIRNHSSRGRAPAGGRTGTRVRLPSASVPFPRSR